MNGPILCVQQEILFLVLGELVLYVINISHVRFA